MQINEKTDALALIHTRNAFYRKKFHLALAVFSLCLIVIGILISVLVYLKQHPTKPLYFVTDSVGRLILDVPRNQPNMTREEVEAWAIEAVESAFSYDFVNYRSQLQRAQKYFTEYGWRSYMDGLRSTNNLLALTQRKLVIIAKVVNKPKLEVEGILGGAYAWKFQVPVLVTYLLPPYNEKTQFKNPLLVTVVIQRQSVISSYKGLGVVQVIGTLATAPAAPNLTATPAT